MPVHPQAKVILDALAAAPPPELSQLDAPTARQLFDGTALHSAIGKAPAVGSVMTAEFDPPRDEGEADADASRAAGVEPRHPRYDGVFHGFFSMVDGLDVARSAMNDAPEVLRRAFRD